MTRAFTGGQPGSRGNAGLATVEKDDVTRVLIVDDHHVVRQGLRRVLECDDGIQVVGEAGDGERAIAQAASLGPDVIIMDLRMPGMDGLTATREIKRLMPEIRVLVLTVYQDDYVRLAMDAGADGYLLKDGEGEQIAVAIRNIRDGLRPMAPSLGIKAAADYGDLFGRNYGYLSPEDQEKVRAATLLLAGCGLGSKVATLAARTGFTHFMLADGDSVAISNLNRQAFRLGQVGKNKALATADLIREVNPAVDIQIIPHFINADEAPQMVGRADVIVNMVDAGPALYAINRAARHQKKTAFFPLNIGFGGVALAFTPESSTLEEMIGPDAAPETAFLRLAEQVMPHLPYIVSYSEKLAPVLDDILSGERPGPQLGIAASINAALVVASIVRITLGLPVRGAPLPLALDAWECSK